MASSSNLTIPFARQPLSAGPGAFPELVFDEIDANALLSGGSPASCILFPVTGNSCDPGIPHGSIAVVNRLLEPLDGHTIACSLDGLNHIKRFERTEPLSLRLVSPNSDYKPIEVMPHDEFDVIGVVMWALIPKPRTSFVDEPIYSLTDLKPTGHMFRAKFEATHGESIEMTVPRETLVDGIKMATQALKENILKWRGR